jgi:hypothetical protein
MPTYPMYQATGVRVRELPIRLDTLMEQEITARRAAGMLTP